MEQLIRIFDELESKGWVCLLKWDGERTSMRKTVIVQNAADDRFFRGDFDTFVQALESLREWLLEPEVDDHASEAGREP